MRECHEETGIVFTGRPRLLGTHFTTDRGDDWPANHIGFVFDGGELTDEQIAAVVLDPGEHSEYALRTLEEWEREMDPAEFGRLAAVDRARRTGTPVYLEAGPGSTDRARRGRGAGPGGRQDSRHDHTVPPDLR